MNGEMLARALNFASYAGILCAYVFTAWSTHFAAQWFRVVFDYELPGKPLPNLTEAMLYYGTAGISAAINLASALMFGTLLIFLELGNEKRRAFIPFCITIAFAFVVLQLGAFLLAVAMPYLGVTFGMSGAKH